MGNPGGQRWRAMKSGEGWARRLGRRRNKRKCLGGGLRAMRLDRLRGRGCHGACVGEAGLRRTPQ
eukprot:12278384-Alexandrium_andersonii.AAC.1